MVARNMMTLVGRLGTAEEWSTRWNFGPTGVGPGPYTDPLDLAQWAEDAVTNIAANLATSGAPLQVFLSNAGTIDSVRVDYIDVNDVVQASGEAPASIVGANPVLHPYQTAACFSLRTPLPGARNRGRSYWPYLGGAVEGTTGNIGAVLAQQAVEQFSGLISQAEDAQPTTNQVRLGVASLASQTVTPVTSISLGNTLDTQRRRRNGLVETYFNDPYPI